VFAEQLSMIRMVGSFTIPFAAWNSSMLEVITQAVVKEFYICVRTSVDVNFEISSLFNPVSKDTKCGSVEAAKEQRVSFAVLMHTSIIWSLIWCATPK
jgi:hypothetical protein